jgi:hypothetical protein
MKIVPFKGVLWLLGGARRQRHGKRRLRVLWLLGGARRQLHGKRRLRVLWLLGGARRQLHGKRRLRVLWLLVGGALVMHAKKGRISTSTAETLIVLLQLLVYTFCNFKGNEVHIRYMLQIHLLFLLDFFFFWICISIL